MKGRASKALVLTGLVLFLAACAETPMLRKPIERERVYSQPVEKVWETAILNLARSGNIINSSDKSSGLITFSKVLNSDDLRNFTSEANRSGALGGGRMSQGTGYMNFLIRPLEDNKTKVYINGRIQVRATYVSSRGDPVQLLHYATSNGKMEDELMDQLAVELGEKEFPWLKKEEGAKEEKKK